jgi:NADH dehydrogenase
MRSNRILVFGGAGFIGRHVVARLVDRGAAVTVPSRRRAKATHLILLPTVEAIECDIHDDAVLGRLIVGQDAVINLVGVLQGARDIPYGGEFAGAHVELPRRIVAMCKTAGVRRLLHMSALGADSNGPSMYQRSKGDGEQLVRDSMLDWTIFRPSVVFGPEDRFLNLFATMAAWMPLLPIGGADVLFQPVYVGDVADAFVHALDAEATFGKTYELAGPEIRTLRELVQFAASAAGHPRPVIGLPDSLARLQARLMELAPGEPLLSRDNLDSMQRDNIASVQPYVPAVELGLTLHRLEFAAHYLSGHSPRTRLGSFRARARR